MVLGPKPWAGTIPFHQWTQDTLQQQRHGMPHEPIGPGPAPQEAAQDPKARDQAATTTDLGVILTQAPSGGERARKTL